MLPDCDERCMATEMSLAWEYTNTPCGTPPDYKASREVARREMLKCFYGPSEGGIFSPSLQATIYDGGCQVLTNAPRVVTMLGWLPW